MPRFRRITLTSALLGLSAAVASPGAAQSPGATIAGIVTDSIHRRPLEGATVLATPTSATHDTIMHVATTDANGHFTIPALPGGRYAVTVEHPWIDSTGIGVPPAEIVLAAGATANTTLAIPSTLTLRRLFCPQATRDTSVGVILGVVRRTDGAVVPAARVVFSWGDFDVDPRTAAVTPRQVNASITADSSGVYRACGLPVARSLYIQAQAGATQSGIIEEQISGAGLLVRDFHLSGLASVGSEGGTVENAPGARPAAGQFTLTGKVLTTDGQPIRSAQIKLFGTDRVATTTDAGDFRLADVPGGTQGIEVMALGFYPQRVRLEIDNETHALTMKMERAATVLDSIRVTAKRVHASAMYGEFDAELKRGVGHAITEEDIAKRNPFVVTDLLQTVPGLSVSVDRDGHATVRATRGINTIMGSTASCPIVYIDGVPSSADDLDLVVPSSIHGIEVYSQSEAPVKYGSTCGVILIWTRVK